MNKLLINAFILIILATACNQKEAPVNQEKTKSAAQTTKENDNKAHIIKETFVTKWNETDNIDSPAFWLSEDGSIAWIIATSKSRDNLYVYDATTGDFIKTVGKYGSAKGEFARPNGIWVEKDYLFVVERDNRRVQIMQLPSFKTIGMFGENDLTLPYGISLHKSGDKYIVYITDDYKNEKDETPEISKLNNRIAMYELTETKNSFDAKLIKKFGDTTKAGALLVVESIYADPENGNLLISEEDSVTYIKVYDLDGDYKKLDLGKDVFKYQAEGIALYDKGNGEGYWITTDQEDFNNTFHIFDRKSLKHICSFKLKTTANTDGIWLTRCSYKGFPNGAFFAVHDDGGVSAVDWKLIQNIINSSK